MKLTGLTIDRILAVFITIILLLFFLIAKNSEANKIQYDPPCSLKYQLTILEQKRCDHE